MKTIRILAMVAFCTAAATGWARTMSVASYDRDSVTLDFGQPDGADYMLCVAYGDASGGENKYKWTAFRRNVATIAADQTTFTYQLPSDFNSGMFYRFFLLQTENLPYVRELAYIASTSTAYGNNQGTQFIDTGIVGKSGTKMEANYVWLAGSDSTILGSRKDDTDTRFFMSHMYYNEDWCVGYLKWIDAAPYVGYKPGDVFHVICELDAGLQTLVVNGREMYHGTNSSSIDTGRTMYVFGSNNAGVQKVCIKAQLWDMKIWQNDVLVRDYCPVALANGEGALYDGVTGAIFTNGSSTPFVLGEAADEANRRGIVRAMSPVLEVLTEEESRIPVDAYWEGDVDGDLAKVGNWRCYNRVGVQVASTPISTTVVHFSGMVNASGASTPDTLGAAKIVCDDVHLAADCDWRAFGSVPFEGHLDLNGWKLRLAGLTGTGAITDRPFAVDGYEAVDYVESCGRTYIDSGVIGSAGVTVEIDMTSYDTASDCCYVGSRKGNMRFLPFWGTGSKICFGYNAFIKGGALENGTRYVGYNRMRAGSQNTFLNGLLAVSKDDASEYNTGLNMYIFSVNWDGVRDYSSYLRLYSTRFWTGDGTQLVRDFVPVKRTSDGALGLYDKVAGKFHAGQGADPLTSGPVVAAPGPAGELWVDVAAGVTNVNTSVLIGGSAKLVKSGKGVYRTMVLNQTYTGGTRVADGIFDQGVNSANDSMPLGQNEVTVVFDKETGAVWDSGCYYIWETRPANTTFTLSTAMRLKGYILEERPNGIFIKQPKFYIFFR